MISLGTLRSAVPGQTHQRHEAAGQTSAMPLRARTLLGGCRLVATRCGRGTGACDRAELPACPGIGHEQAPPVREAGELDQTGSPDLFTRPAGQGAHS